MILYASATIKIGYPADQLKLTSLSPVVHKSTAILAPGYIEIDARFRSKLPVTVEFQPILPAPKPA